MRQTSQRAGDAESGGGCAIDHRGGVVDEARTRVVALHPGSTHKRGNGQTPAAHEYPPPDCPSPPLHRPSCPSPAKHPPTQHKAPIPSRYLGRTSVLLLFDPRYQNPPTQPSATP